MTSEARRTQEDSERDHEAAIPLINSLAAVGATKHVARAGWAEIATKGYLRMLSRVSDPAFPPHLLVTRRRARSDRTEEPG